MADAFFEVKIISIDKPNHLSELSCMSALSKIAFYQNRRDEVPTSNSPKNWRKPKMRRASRKSPRTCSTRTRASKVTALRFCTKSAT